MSDEIRIVLIGKTGVGKSSTGNTILNAEKFDPACSASSVTKTCSMEVGNFGSKKTIIVDTPGLCDTKLSEKEVMKEILKCVGMLSEGIHAFVFVISIANRFTEEERKAVQSFAERFGKNIYDHGIVVFTRLNDLLKRKKSIESYVSTAPEELKTILHLCGNRYLALENDALFDNKERQEKQVEEFFAKVSNMIEENCGKLFTNEMLVTAEAVMKEKIEEERQRVLQEKKKIEEELLQRERAEQERRERMQQEKFEAKLAEELKENERKLREEREKIEKEFQERLNAETLRQELRVQIVKEDPGLIGSIANGMKAAAGYLWKSIVG